MAVFELMEAEGKIAALKSENERLRANNKWLVERLRDAVNVCYGGVSHDEIDGHEMAP